jgi:hypothetical protein
MHAREPRRGNVNIMLFPRGLHCEWKTIGNVLYTHFAWRVVNNGASCWTLLVQRKGGNQKRNHSQWMHLKESSSPSTSHEDCAT